jgi:opacity protein-like surface antigen
MIKKIAVIVFVSALAGAPLRAQLQVNGYLSFEYRKGQAQSDSPKGEFDKLRAGLFFTGRLETVFDYDLEVRLDNHGDVEVQEAWAGYRASEAFHLKLGMYLVPFGTYNTASRPYQTPFVQPPLADSALYPENWRDLGAVVEGRLGVLRYSGYLGNGLREAVDLASGQQFADNNGNKALGGRVVLTLSQGFDVGLSYHRGKFDNANTRNLVLEGADASWITRGFRVLYEYGRASIDNPSGFDKGKIQGHTVLVSLSWGGLTPVGSYQTLDYKDLYHGAGFSAPLAAAGAGISEEISRWTIGLLYTPTANVFVKVEYDFNREQQVEIKNDVLVAQVALQF